MPATNSNFYQIGASLPVDAPSYVQRQADEEFYQKLQAGKFCYVLNSRQMGKSSLRVQTMQRLEKEGTICAAIDLTGIGNVTQQQWYGGIVYNLSESCQLEDKFDFDWQEWWQKHQTVLSPVQCLNLFIEKVLLAKIQQPIVIFVDEIDKVLSQDFSLDDFFALIRFFQNQRVDNPIFERLTFALLGVATPGDLIQNKTQTPFNIGEAIELHGFQIDEVEPLIKGLEGRFDNPPGVMAEILDWTGGQPFLTQKLCKFMVEESEKDHPRSVEEVVNKRIIENWESQDDPEHLRTIRDRILSSEQRAGYLLELYQQIQQHGEVAGSKSLESSELRLSGLVVQREGKLRVYNRVYQQVFNKNWVETQLNNLRPYSEAFRAWVASGYSDESRLLQGKALEGADKWAKDKDLSFQDKQFLAASREKEIAVRNKEAELERERKDREAAEKRNLVLSEANQKLAIANKKAQQRIRVGSIVLILTLLGSLTSIIWAGKDIQEIQKTTKLISQLSKLSGELYKQDKSSAASQAREQIGLAYEIPNHQLRKAMLKISTYQAFQELEQWNKAENEIQESLNILKNFNQESNQVLQIKVLAYKAKADLLLAQKQDKNKAIETLKSAFEIIDSNPEKTNPFTRDKQLLTTEDIESVHRGLLQQNRNQQVRDSLKKHFYARLENSLKLKNWRGADLTTDKLMLFITNRETEGWLNISQIQKFSCNDLKEIDQLWVDNSNKRFGFTVQKQIWLNTGNRLGIIEASDEDIKSYEQFASRIGWYGVEQQKEEKSDLVEEKNYFDDTQVYELIGRSNNNKLPVGLLPRRGGGFGALKISAEILDCTDLTHLSSNADSFSDSSIVLSSKSLDAASNLAAMEKSVYQQINQYRRSKGLAPLKLNGEISKIAREHSQQMASKQVAFGHNGSNSRFQKISKLIRWRGVAENVAYNQGYKNSGKFAVEGWIKSPGHQRNMVGKYQVTGIGVAKNSQGEYYFTQLFVNQR